MTDGDALRGSRRELYELVGTLAAAFPVPDPSWHRHVPEMRVCLVDLRRALAVAERLPAVLELATEAVEGELAEGFDADHAGAELRAAHARLGLLPAPAGEHPYLDEILPTLEAMAAMLVAVSLVPEAVDAFERVG